MEDTTYPSLSEFLSRSLPPLVALFIRLDNEEFRDLKACFRHVVRALETLELEAPSKRALQILYRTLIYFPHLHTLAFSDVPEIEYKELLQFLLASPQIRSFRLSRFPGTFRDDWIYLPKSIHDRTIKAHFADLAKRGMNIHIPTGWTTHLDLVG
ncbi:hypothetical protein FB451DRAFT_1181132 [Mycena latifolia]|nr:hypothetical protein FB451DRAFT_1181132 [Mycena latifolia]